MSLKRFEMISRYIYVIIARNHLVTHLIINFTNMEASINP